MKSAFPKIIGSFGCVALLALTACDRASQQAVEPATQSPAAPAQTGSLIAASDTQTTAEQLRFKREDGSEAFSIKFKPDGAKLVDGRDQELARFNLDENQKLKIKGPNEEVLGYVVAKDGYWKLENADQTKELFILRRREDGDYKLEDGNDTQLYRIKVRDYGYEIETPQKESLYKVRVNDGKVSLRNASGETVISTKSPIAPIAVASFGLDALSPEQQAALAFAINRTEG
ncbi:MAG: hypothetical protein F6J97_09430 [Leptolyngbya sp. SIO4C1]|nr:hypothetical protein [Leptolyngbya sp. SIO4C1]